MSEPSGGRVVLAGTLVAVVLLLLVALSVGATAAWVGVANVVRPAPTFPAVVAAPTAVRATPTGEPTTRATPPAVAEAPRTPTRASEEALEPTDPARTPVATAPPVADAPVPTPNQTDAPEPEVANVAPPAPPAEPIVFDAFDERGSLPERVSERGSASYDDGRFLLTLSGQSSIGVTTPIEADDYDLSVDITATHGVAGLVFLSRLPTTFYRIMVNLDGEWTIEEVNGQNVRAIYDWTANPAVRTGANATNRVRVVRRDRMVGIWINDRHITQWMLPAGELRGQYGLVLSSPDARGEASFDNLTVGKTSS